MYYLDLPISCADYLTGKIRPLLEDGSYSKLMSDTLQTIKDSNQIITLTNDQRMMDWYLRNEHKLRRDFQIPRLFVNLLSRQRHYSALNNIYLENLQSTIRDADINSYTQYNLTFIKIGAASRQP